MTSDQPSSRRLVDFEVELRTAVADRVIEAEWGRAFLTPTMPQVWDATLLAIETPGLKMSELAAIADETLGGAGFAHRTALVCDEADGARLAAEVGEAPGWYVERIEYMTWREDSGRVPGVAVGETTIEQIAALRAEQTGEFFEPGSADREATIEQLVELDRRSCLGGGDRWFVAPPVEPLAACCLFSAGGIGQVENVVTLRRARGKGLAQAVTLAALAASREAGNELTFLSADAEDWPLKMYAKLGFQAAGSCYVLRRAPT